MQIALPKQVQSRISSELRRAGSQEIGGLLLGEQLDDDGRFRIVDFTVDPDSGEHAYFERRPEAHNAALQAFFERNGNDYGRFNYLGEWHSHPSFPVRPRRTDVTTMQALVEDGDNIDFAVLMIVRLRMFVMLQVSANLFMRGHGPQPVELVEDRRPRPTRRWI